MKNIFLIGTGPMARDYVQVLNGLNYQFKVIGRGENSAKEFENLTGIKPVTGGIENYVKNNRFTENSYVIIATGTQDLLKTMEAALNAGAENVLVEKPAALSIDELLKNKKKLTPYLNKVFIAYNRRFYASVTEAMRMITEDGGLQSMHFEFTEWAHKIEPLEKAPGVKENWFFANSTHVVDLAFFIAGTPVDWKTFSKPGEIKWHEKTNFAGAGITNRNVIFSYIANWESAGRWAIELLTKERRIYLKPLESIGIQAKGTINVINHEFDDTLDRLYKPGLFMQTRAFLENDLNSLCSLKEHFQALKNYTLICCKNK